MYYVEAALIIVAVGLILFIMHVCTCMNKWRQYIQDLDKNDNNESTGKTTKCVLHENCSASDNTPPPYSTTATCVIDIDRPPKYEEAVKSPNQSGNNQQFLAVEVLPQVHIISDIKSTAQQQEQSRAA